MNIPGFTANASLYNAGGRYRGTRGRGGATANASAILPQLPRQIELLQCLGDCTLSGAGPECREACHWNDFLNQGAEVGETGGASGGGAEPRCRPHCSRCLPDFAAETGRSVTCVRADCSEMTFDCPSRPF